VGSGLFVRHLAQARDIDLGFAANHLAVMTVAPGDQGYDPAQVHAFYDELESRARALPGVEAASWSANRLLRGSVIQHEVFVAGSQEPVSGGGRLYHRTDAVRPGFFETVGIPLLQGRDFDSSDRADSRKVAIVNQTMAKLLWPGENPIGRHFHFDYLSDPEVEVVGVARDAKYRYIHEEPQFFIYVPFSQSPPSGATLHVRTAGDPRDILPALRAQTHELDPAMPVADLAPLTDVDGELWLERAAASFLSVMGLLALILVAIGVHGVMAFSVRRRAREIGVRLSLGATRSQVVRHILGRAGERVAVGVALGMIGVIAILRPAAAGFLGDVDPWLTAALAVGAAVLIAVVALGGSLRLVRSAARDNPSFLLREE
jgi:predicted permease